METSAALQSRASQEVGKSIAELYTKAGSDPGECFILRLLSLYTLHISDWAVYSMLAQAAGSTVHAVGLVTRSWSFYDPAMA